jgi:arylsulfatase A-like enzyme
VHSERGLRTTALASLLDVGPTLLDIEGLSVPATMQGVSQLPVALGMARTVREHAVARCGFQTGFAVMDSRYCYERTLPWSVRDRELLVSWYGTAQPAEEPREVLHDRRHDRRIGHLASSPKVDPEIAPALEQVGANWLKSSGELRQRLQAVTWPEPAAASWMGDELATGGSPGSPP